MERIQAIDLGILNWIQEHLACGFFDVTMPAITRLGDVGFIWILLGCVLLFLPRERSLGIRILLGIVFSALICNLFLKNLVGRVRPFELVETVRLLVEMPHDSSFPSGHTSAAFAAAVVVLKSKWRWHYWVLALAVLVAASRLYLYVHFPTDVLGGMVTGTVSGLLACGIVSRIEAYRSRRPEESITESGK